VNNELGALCRVGKLDGVRQSDKCDARTDGYGAAL
jgi:hypothetical protein